MFKTDQSRITKKNQFTGKVLKGISKDYFDDDRAWYVVYWEDGSNTSIFKECDIELEFEEAIGMETIEKFLKEAELEEDVDWTDLIAPFDGFY
jgi:hypothetical protein